SDSWQTARLSSTALASSTQTAPSKLRISHVTESALSITVIPVWREVAALQEGPQIDASQTIRQGWRSRDTRQDVSGWPRSDSADDCHAPETIPRRVLPRRDRRHPLVSANLGQVRKPECRGGHYPEPDCTHPGCCAPAFVRYAVRLGRPHGCRSSDGAHGIRRD